MPERGAAVGSKRSDAAGCHAPKLYGCHWPACLGTCTLLPMPLQGAGASGSGVELRAAEAMKQCGLPMACSGTLVLKGAMLVDAPVRA